MKVGDLVAEKTKMDRKPEMGIVLRTDGKAMGVRADEEGVLYPYQVYFFDGEVCWMQARQLEVVECKSVI